MQNYEGHLVSGNKIVLKTCSAHNWREAQTPSVYQGYVFYNLLDYEIFIFSQFDILTSLELESSLFEAAQLQGFLLWLRHGCYRCKPLQAYE